MHINTSHQKFRVRPNPAALPSLDAAQGPVDGADLFERDEDWEDFVALALPRAPVDEEPATPWRRAPVMLSY